MMGVEGKSLITISTVSSDEKLSVSVTSNRMTCSPGLIENPYVLDSPFASGEAVDNSPSKLEYQRTFNSSGASNGDSLSIDGITVPPGTSMMLIIK